MDVYLAKSPIFSLLKSWGKLLRWNKPSGRLILLIPAGWSLWLTPGAPPAIELLGLILLGGVFISGAGCIANDLWDIRIDRQVSRTKTRPLAQGTVRIKTAWLLLTSTLLLSLFVVLKLPIESREICLKLALLALIPILIYPSAKRWFKYPQALLAFCWGFSVLIPWAASESSLSGGWPLISCWAATVFWTFGFDTVYAMADQKDDVKLGLNSSVISLGKHVFRAISICYGITSLLIAIAAKSSQVNLIFWPIWLISSWGMQREISSIKGSNIEKIDYLRHFKNQVLLGTLILLGLVIGKLNI